MLLDLSSLTSALASLERALKRATAAKKDEELRDGAIQRFEYTYELCFRLLKRRIEADALVPANVDTFDFKTLLRTGAERGFIDDPERWFEYRLLRNLTSHTYDQKKARKVFAALPKFFRDASRLLAALTVANQKHR